MLVFLSQSSRLRRRLPAAVGALSSLLFTLSCADVSAPSARADAYVLTSVAGRPVAAVNLFALIGLGDTLNGAFAYTLADTLVFYDGGRGEQRAVHQWTSGIDPYVPGDTLVVRHVTLRRYFRYVEHDGILYVAHERCQSSCFDGSPRLARNGTDGLRSEGYGNGEWLYKPIFGRRAP